MVNKKAIGWSSLSFVLVLIAFAFFIPTDTRTPVSTDIIMSLVVGCAVAIPVYLIASAKK